VREAACACISELGNRVDKDAVRPYVPRLLTALIECFRDESWPVRDASCVASGKFIRCFPEEARGSLEDLYKLFFAHVHDNIGSVRENAAAGLGCVMEAYGEEALAVVMGELPGFLAAVKEQPESSTKNANLQNVTTFGVAAPTPMDLEGGATKVTFPANFTQSRPTTPSDDGHSGHQHGHGHGRGHEHEHEDSSHENQVMYSCGSLAPKLKRKGGCMDHGYARAVEPWEKTDG